MNHTIHLIAPRGNTLAVTAAGSGQPLVLLHGFPLDYRLWRHQLADLSTSRQVLAVHLRGFGQSTLDESDFRLSDLADDVEFLRRHLSGDRRIALVGLSMGGYVALEYWYRYPENLSALVLSNTKPDAENADGQRTRLAMAKTAVEQGTWAAAGDMPPRLLAEQSFRDQPELVELVESMIRQTPPMTVAAAQRAMSERRGFRDCLPRINVPTLVVTGQHDAISPAAYTEQWSKDIPGARFEVIAGAGHLPPLESPQAYNRVLSTFLDSIKE